MKKFATRFAKAIKQTDAAAAKEMRRPIGDNQSIKSAYGFERKLLRKARRTHGVKLATPLDTYEPTYSGDPWMAGAYDQV